MNRIILFLFFIVSLSSYGQKYSLSSVQKNENGVTISLEEKQIEISFLKDNIIHVRTYPAGQEQKPSLIVNDKAFAAQDIKCRSLQNKIILKSAKVEATYDILQDRVLFTDVQNSDTILVEGGNHFSEVDDLGEKAYTVSQTFILKPDEAIYGLGQYQDGVYNYRGHKELLVHANREIANPVIVSTSNYVLFWDNYSCSTFEDTPDGATFTSEIGDGVNYYLVVGKDMKDAMSGYCELTGNSPMLPKSAFGFWMSKERYKTFDELQDVVRTYRMRNIPLDNIVQDWQYWGENLDSWNGMVFNPVTHPNPQKVIEDLHKKYHVKLTLSVWPGFGKSTKIYQEMDSANVLYDVPTWAGYKVADIYAPTAQKIFWNHLYQGLYTKGVDSWWLDATEPAYKDGLYPEKQTQWSKKVCKIFSGGEVRYLNTNLYVLTKMMYENLRKQSDNRASVLTRSAFAGQQRFGTSIWSGDIYASWDVLKKQLVAGLNICMTGIPYWTTDIGGFRVRSRENSGEGTGEIGTEIHRNISSCDGGYAKGLKDSAYLELYTRWFQYGALSPIFRAHGTEVPREIWHFGEPGSLFYDIQVEMIHLRYSLLSYIYSEAWKVTSKGPAIMRGTVVDFSDDRKTFDDGSSYMFGDALMIHPITRPMYYNREGAISDVNTLELIYLPQHSGTYWFDLHSNRCYEGGQEIKYDAPLEKLPIFVKAGSIVPRNKVVQYVAQDDGSEIMLSVYAGKDAEFLFYEDDNETYAYERGGYSAIQMKWDNKHQTFTLFAPIGKMPPKLENRKFKIQIFTPLESGHVSVIEKDIIYNNKTMKLKF